MKATNRELKFQAKQTLNGKWGFMILLQLVMGVIVAGSNGMVTALFKGENLLGIITSEAAILIVGILLVPLSVGFCRIFLRVMDGENPSMKDMFYFYKNGPDRILKSGLVIALVQEVASIPTILYSYGAPAPDMSDFQAIYESYNKLIGCTILSMLLQFLLLIPLSMTVWILAEDLEIDGIEALRKSVRMMKGNIVRYIAMYLSFLPWALMLIVTFGLGIFWLEPYMRMTEAFFYMHVKEKQKTSIIE